MLRVCSWLVPALLAATFTSADVVSGPARVIDGDTLAIGGEKIRLHGIDAPERKQTCPDAHGTPWPCGRWSGELLADMISDQSVTCRGNERDRYGRLIAVCSARGRELNAEMVEQGAAQAYRKYALDYVDAEKRAYIVGRGIWQGDPQSPEAFRRAAAQQTVSQVATNGCHIKGNISKSGRIYHMPGQRDYDRTRISTAKGERWFCSESEARASGWRRAAR